MTESNNLSLVSHHVYTKDEVEAFVSDIESQVCESNGVAFHSMAALNHIMRQPNAGQIVDSELKTRMADLWRKLKSADFDLQDPPLLFGIPECANEARVVDESLDDGTQSIVFTIPPDEEEQNNKKRSNISDKDELGEEDEDDYEEI